MSLTNFQHNLGRSYQSLKVVAMVMALLLSALALNGLIASTAHAQPPPEAPANTIDITRDLAFAQYDDYQLKLDLYRPAPISAPLPVVIAVREGGWQHGAKDFAPLAAALAQRGLAAASIEYRGASEAIFPAFIHDTKAAIRWLRANAEAYDLDPNAIGAIGGSWGGYLSAYAGVTSGIAGLEGDGGSTGTSSRLSAVVAISAPLNLADFADRMERHLGEAYESDPDLWEFASVTSHVSEDSPPLLLIASQADTTVPYEQSLMMAEAYGDAGAEVELHLLPGIGHAPFWHYNQWLHDRVAEFFLRHLDGD